MSFDKRGTGSRDAALTLQFEWNLSPLFLEVIMGNLLHYAVVFLVVALISAALGFGGVAGVAVDAAKLLFWVFLVLFVVSLIVGLARRT